MQGHPGAHRPTLPASLCGTPQTQHLYLTHRREGTECRGITHLNVVNFTPHEFYLEVFKGTFPCHRGSVKWNSTDELNLVASMELPARLPSAPATLFPGAGLADLPAHMPSGTCARTLIAASPYQGHWGLPVCASVGRAATNHGVSTFQRGLTHSHCQPQEATRLGVVTFWSSL